MFSESVVLGKAAESRYSDEELKFLNLLAEKFPTIQAASTEIINLEAILTLPKGTEHFLTDIHGEYETFSHVLRNASGVVRKKIDDVFGKLLSQREKRQLATLIYYPEDKLQHVLRAEPDANEWYSITLRRLVEVARVASQKYSRSKVRKTLPEDFAYIIDELLYEAHSEQKEDYYDGIIQTIIEIDRAAAFVVAISNFIQNLLIDRLHIIGDIFDRGPYPDRVMDALIDHHSVDIQWGNHDILWMGAAAGIPICVISVIRIAARYANLDSLEDAYGINLWQLATFAMNTYGDDECKKFMPKGAISDAQGANAIQLAQIQKAAFVVESKLESQLLKRNPNFDMADRRLLEKIDFEAGTVEIDGAHFPLLDTHFPTIDPKDPTKLSDAEQEMMMRLCATFLTSEKLQRHVKYLYAKGSMYLQFNSNLLFHGCIPLTESGEFQSMLVEGKRVSGKELCDALDLVARKAYIQRSSNSEENLYADYMWYLWCGPSSPLFGKQKMATFERYFLEEKATHKEGRNGYYNRRDDVESCQMILQEFGLDPEHSHIVNGHVPVKVSKGESPIKANGKLFVIDGGMSKPYQQVTGIAGYTLIYNSFSLAICEHKPFKSRRKAIEEEVDIVSVYSLVEHAGKRIKVGDTDIGATIRQQVDDLKKLLSAYRKGVVKMKV